MKLLQMCTDELKRRLPIDYKGVSSSWIRFLACAVLTLLPGSGQGGDERWYPGGRL